jgi:hypothetical protein
MGNCCVRRSFHADNIEDHLKTLNEEEEVLKRMIKRQRNDEKNHTHRNS